jgi:hypothetical protein
MGVLTIKEIKTVEIPSRISKEKTLEEVNSE